MSKELQKTLIELSNRVNDYLKIDSTSEIQGIIELSADFELPYQFTCEALHPGVYKGFTIMEEDIYQARDTIFLSGDNYHNNEINKDHKNSRKEDSSVSDVVGKVIQSNYDFNKQAYILKGEIYDKEIALKVANRLVKYVSLRIKPGHVQEIDGMRIARDLTFEELSFVRVPGDPNVKIY